MNYTNALEYIHSLFKFGMKPGLERVKALCDRLSNPQNKLKIIHVAGTNGKGSTAAMLASAFTADGKKTGLFTSPYVIDYKEQLMIDGKMISEAEFAELISCVKSAAEGLEATEFEVLTAAAFLWFLRNDCDICVIEAGLGGRLDSTNVIKKPLASVITSISLDHTAILGDSLKKIAAEKCGIIKEGCDTVLYPLQNAEVISTVEAACKCKNSKLHLPPVPLICNSVSETDGSNFSLEGQEYFVPLLGDFQVYNAATAITVLKLLGVSQQSISDGFKTLRLPARFEKISAEMPVYLDGGHNAQGGEMLAKLLSSSLSGKRLLGISAMMSDKSCRDYYSVVAPLFSKIITTHVPSNPRSASPQELQKIISEFCVDCISAESPASALLMAKAALSEYDALIVCGSFYLARELRAEMQKMF